MKHKLLLIVIAISLFACLFGCQPTTDLRQGVITDKWAMFYHWQAVPWYFEINNSFVIETDAYDYHNYEIGDTYQFSERDIARGYYGGGQ